MKITRNIFELYDGVKKYVLFIGHARSGHSIVGSLLDAHPEVIISHEFGSGWEFWKNETVTGRNLRKYIFFFNIHKNSQFNAYFGRRAPLSFINEGEHTYIYHVPGQWQGQYRDKITAIGDKSGHFTSEYFKNPARMVKLDYLQKTLGVSLKIIHVIRNPYDNIATRTLRAGGGQDRDKASPEDKVDKSESLSTFIQNYFGRTEANERIRQKYDVLDLPGHELVQQPKQSMQKLCDYLDIICEEDYIEACAKLLYGEPSITRNHVVWTDEQKRWVQQEIDKYSFLRRYSFESYP